MSETAHTPGPWHLDTMTAAESYFEDVNILRHDGLAVAVAVQNGDITPQQAVANARLIAAGPDLLAIARALESYATVQCRNYPDAVEVQTIWKPVLAAVAKATGSA